MTTSILIPLMAHGPLNAKTLCKELGISQPTLSRLISTESSKIKTIGKSRSVKYAALRPIQNHGSVFPINRIEEDGTVTELGILTAIHPRGFIWEEKNEAKYPRIFPGIPYFLVDSLAQGFLGRQIPKQHPELQLPQRLEDWSENHFFEVLICRGEDSSGNLVVGKESLNRFLQSKHTGLVKNQVQEKNLALEFERIANEATLNQYLGSSLAGEQPKFLIAIKKGKETKHCLVKFHSKSKDTGSTRWGDLLLCEQIANQVLKENVASSFFLQSPKMNFLQVIRFDRTGQWGRTGLVSLAAILNEFAGDVKNWSIGAQQLFILKKISENDRDQMILLDTFGELIGNTDRHFGNLSFYPDEKFQKFILAPVYDMLPMYYAPTPTGKVHDFSLKKIVPSADNIAQWQKALALAIQFWEIVSKEKRISSGFRKIAVANLKALAS